MLERPFQEVLLSGKPDFPFCLGWANHSWTNKSWEVGTKKVKEATLMEMIYNKEEYIKHFYEVLPAFKDKRYIQVDGKPLFLVLDHWRYPILVNLLNYGRQWHKKMALRVFIL